MKLATLYCKDSTGSTRQWTIEIKDNKYRTISGQLNSDSLVTNEWTTCEGKNIGRANETTPKDQAKKEAEALFKKKLKEGYYEDIKEIDKEKFFQVMLAKKLKDYINKIKFPAIIDRKYNGMHLLMRKSGAFTRKGEECKTVPHIYDYLKPIFKQYPDIILDGEGYNHDLRYKLNDLMHLLRRTVHITPEDLEQSQKIVKFYCYDGFGFDNITDKTPLIERRKALKKLLKDIPYVEIVEGTLVGSEKEMMDLYQSYIDDGYEGAMYRDPTSPYESKRSKYLLKIKPEDDDEGIILDIKEGSGNWSKAGKIITLKWKDKIFDATFKGSYEQAVEFLNNKDKWIGKQVTFLYNATTGLGTPNFARVDINNCIKS